VIKKVSTMVFHSAGRKDAGPRLPGMCLSLLLNLRIGDEPVGLVGRTCCGLDGSLLKHLWYLPRRKRLGVGNRRFLDAVMKQEVAIL
jgi:hypothetical protein